VAWNAPRLDLVAQGTMTFHAPDLDAFPMLRLARHALETGRGLPIVFNAANEVCVQAFLDRRIGFLQIAEYVETAMMRAQLPSMPSPVHASRDKDDTHMVLALETDSAVRTLMQDLFTRVGA
jgi:1-deoxy-D-xylulose-5-phosphate reductoisomerase